MIYLDATAIDCWLRCREAYRLRYLQPIFHPAKPEAEHGIQPIEPSIHQAFGHAVHIAIEAFWKGYKYEDAVALAYQDMEAFPVQLLNPLNADKWRDLGNALPDMIASYFDGVEYEEGTEIEREFDLAWNSSVRVCGKIDRFHRGHVFDLKTASEIGRTWKADYRNSLLRSFQFGLYDWAHRVRETAPAGVTVECLVKPYKGKPARLELFPLPEIVAYRKRFDQQLKWVVSEIQHYHENYLSQHPWPMASDQTCSGKYSPCDYREGCNKGWTPKILESYKPREEHLETRKRANERSVQVTTEGGAPVSR